MPLNNQGPISIGGSNVGESINLELGRAAGATSSLNESALRTLAGVASGAISLSNFYGKANAPSSVEYLVVGGGGGGASGYFEYSDYWNREWKSIGGGGGAGGFRTGTLAVSGGTTYTVTIGAGAPGRVYDYLSGFMTNAQNGGASIFSSITSAGGGGASHGQNGFYSNPPTANTGGSGGGGGYLGTFQRDPFEDLGGACGGGGSGTSGQGNAGAACGGGGGGASAAGVNGPAPYAGGNGGYGGNGTASSISGSSVTYAGGGGGGSWETYNAVNGGSGGGGTGGFNYTNGGTNTGGGGGGGNSGQPTNYGTGGAGSGGSGIVIIRYSNTLPDAASVTGTYTFTNTGGYKIYRFTGSGSIRW